MLFSVVSVAGRDYAFENLRYDLDGGLPESIARYSKARLFMMPERF